MTDDITQGEAIAMAAIFLALFSFGVALAWWAVS